MGTVKRPSKEHGKGPSFTFRDGFYELPYLVNSPQEMIEGFKKMSFIKSDYSKQTISAKTPILDVTVYYRHIEKDLFLIFSEVKFKANVFFKNEYNESKPSEYYCLSLRIDHYSKVNNSLANGISYTDNSWLIFKPGAKVDHTHFKGTKGIYVSVYFTQKWLDSYIKNLPLNERRILNHFLNSRSTHLISPNLSGPVTYNLNYLRKQLNSTENARKTHLKKLKDEICVFINCFTLKLQSENLNKRHFLISNAERIKVLKAEKIIKEHLYNKFPGISYISKEIGMSGTRLKECYKTVYDSSIFQNFRKKQMENAYELLKHTSLPIGQIARNLNYENASKFSLAFKAHFNLLPSEVER